MVPGKSPDAMFVLENVTKRYGETTALEPVSLSIRRGERVALLGPSGSGKTTFLHLIAGVIRPEEGAIFVDGRALIGLDHGPELAGLVGIIHQQFDLVPHLSVIHNVMAGRLGEWGLFRSLASLVSPRQRELAEEALGEVGIPHKIRERTSRLSGGEQQRVAIARLLVQAPEAVLADEPVASLDPARAEDLVELLVRLTKVHGRTLVASLHNVGLARRHFTRAVGLRNGRVAFDMRAEELSDGMLRDLYDLTVLEGDDDGRADAPEAPRDAGGQAAPHAPAAAGVPVELHRRRVE